MGKINGVVSDIHGQILVDAEILFVDRNYNVIGSGYSNEYGEYYLQINEKTNGSVIGTHSYGDRYLAFTHANISTNSSHHIDIRLGNTEFIHFTREMLGERDTYTCVFQLVSLEKMKNKDIHLSPEMDKKAFEVLLDDRVLEDYELTHTKVGIKEKKVTVDQYMLSFKSSIEDRGKVLSLTYRIKSDFGMIRAYL